MQMLGAGAIDRNSGVLVEGSKALWVKPLPQTPSIARVQLD